MLPPDTVVQLARELYDARKTRTPVRHFSQRFPAIPTMSEAGLKGYWMETWWGIFGPAKMPADVVAKLNQALNEILKEPETVAKINGLGYEVRGSTPDEFAKFVVEENQKWAKVITDQGLAGKAGK